MKSVSMSVAALAGTIGLCLACSPASAGWKAKQLYFFQNASAGAGAYGGLIADAAHNLYGVTLFGGGGSCDCGVVYKLSRKGTETVLHTFGGGSDGAYPYEDKLLADSSGNLYGTTADGGGTGCGGSGCGTVFKVTPSGKESILYAFGGGNDGGGPQGGLIADKKGVLYGTTGAYGANAKGTIYRITSGGKLTTLYAFCSLANCSDGATPVAALSMDVSGNLFGTTELGGSNNAGTVFELSAGSSETVLYSFCAQENCADGSHPQGSVSIASTGYLVGVTPYGGSTSCSNGCGVGYLIPPGGGEEQTYLFCSQQNCDDGYLPHEGPVLAKDGNFYGTATAGGTGGDGVVYEVTGAGVYKVLYSFTGAVGAGPYGSLLVSKKLHIFGTTVGNGTGSTVFKLKEK